MRRIFFMAACALLAGAVAQGQAPNLEQMDIVMRSLPDGPVALVDGEPLSKEEFLFLYETNLLGVAQARRSGEIPDDIRIRTALHTMRELINREILLREGVRRNVAVSDAEVDKAYQGQIDELRAQLKKEDGSSPSELELLEMSGQTKEEARRNLRKALAVKKTRELLAQGKVEKITDADIREFYDSQPELFRTAGGYHLRQILIRPGANPKTADESAWKGAEDKIKKAVARVKAGENFAAVAKAVSDAPDKGKGGDMGMLPEDRLPGFYVEAAKRLKAGEISEPIRSEYGMHVVQLVETSTERRISLDEVRPRIEEALRQARIESVVEDFCESVATETERVRVFLHLEKTLALQGAGGKAPSS